MSRVREPAGDVRSRTGQLLEDFEVEAVSVKATKPEPPIPLPVEEVSVTVWRER